MSNPIIRNIRSVPENLTPGLSMFLRQAKDNIDLLAALAEEHNVSLDEMESIVDSHTSSLNLMYRKNMFINGQVIVWQRGTSFTGLTGSSNIWTADRFCYAALNDAVVNVFDPGGYPTECGVVSKSVMCQVTTADTSITSNQYAGFYSYIEGHDIRHLPQAMVTLSFWIYATKTGTYCVSFRNHAGTRSYIAEYEVFTTHIWEKKVITFKFHDCGAGSGFEFGNLRGVSFFWAFAAGSTYHAAPNIWHSDNYLATSNQVNALDTVDNLFAIGGVQFELGEEATKLEYRNWGEERILCERYCQASSGYTYHVGAAYATTYIQVNRIQFNTIMRTAPTISIGSVVTQGSGLGTIGTLYNAIPDTRGFSPIYNTTGATAGYAGQVRFDSWLANAE